MLTPDDINTLAAEVYAQNCRVGWWDDPNRCPLQTLMLVVTEVAEATEGDRKNLMDDHLPHRKMAEVELADTLIRLVDLAGHYGWVHLEAPAGWLLEFCHNAGARHLAIVQTVVELAEVYTVKTQDPGRGPMLGVVEHAYRQAVATVLRVAQIEGYDLEGATREKLAYNATRADHKRENRAKPGGKGY